MADTTFFVQTVNTTEKMLNSDYGLFLHFSELPILTQKRLANVAKAAKIERSENSFGWATQKFFAIQVDLANLSDSDIIKLSSFQEFYRKADRDVISQQDRHINKFNSDENVLKLTITFDDIDVLNYTTGTARSDQKSKLIINWDKAVRRWLDQ